MGFYAFESTGLIETRRVGPWTYKVVYAEPSLPLQKGKRLRFDGEIDDVAVNLAWQPAKDRGHFAQLSPAICRELGLSVGSEVTIRFNLSDDAKVVLPEELERALHVAKKQWASLTPGRRRSYAFLVSSLKTKDARKRRAKAITDELLSKKPSGLLQRQRKNKRQKVHD